jgi:hypothetical protein
MTKPIPFELERLEYWQGQQLKSRDFRDQETTNNQLQWWHNRALHNVYGVAEGLETDFVKTTRTVTIKAGLAYDCFGRPLIVSKVTTIDLPKYSSDPKRSFDLTLVVRVRDEKDFQGCDSTSFRSSGGLEFAWVLSSKFAPENGVALAQLTYDHELKEFSLSKRFVLPRVRRLARPYIQSGSTIFGRTPWQLWREALPTKRLPRSQVFGFQVTVDTSSAGFTEVPDYFASVSTWAFPFYSIGEASMNNFVFRLFVPWLDLFFRLETFGRTREQKAIDFESYVLSIAREVLPAVSWVGLQPVIGDVINFKG